MVEITESFVHHSCDPSVDCTKREDEAANTIFFSLSWRFEYEFVSFAQCKYVWNRWNCNGTSVSIDSYSSSTISIIISFIFSRSGISNSSRKKKKK